MNIEVKAVMLTFLATQKGYVLENLENYSCAMVAVFTAGNESYVQFPEFDSEADKIAACRGIVAEAKEKGATVIITVNQARQLRTEQLEHFQYEAWGTFDQSNSDPCILLTASGPGLESCSLQMRYEILDGCVTFGKEEWQDCVELGLLPDWPGSYLGLLNQCRDVTIV
jgi:hypothetical protein